MNQSQANRGDFVQRAGFFKKVRRPGDDHQLFFAAKQGKRRTIQLDNLEIVTADDEQCGRTDARQCRSGQIGAPAPRDHSPPLYRDARPQPPALPRRRCWRRNAVDPESPRITLLH